MSHARRFGIANLLRLSLHVLTLYFVYLFVCLFVCLFSTFTLLLFLFQVPTSQPPTALPTTTGKIISLLHSLFLPHSFFISCTSSFSSAFLSFPLFPANPSQASLVFIPSGLLLSFCLYVFIFVLFLFCLFCWFVC